MKTLSRIVRGAVAAVGMSAAAAWATETITYTYDARGRLVRVARGGTTNNNVTANYSYDKADNRTIVNVCLAQFAAMSRLANA